MGGQRARFIVSKCDRVGAGPKARRFWLKSPVIKLVAGVCFCGGLHIVADVKTRKGFRIGFGYDGFFTIQVFQAQYAAARWADIHGQLRTASARIRISGEKAEQGDARKKRKDDKN